MSFFSPRASARPRRDTLRDGDRLEIGGATVRLKVNGRARRVSLRLDLARREVIATAPNARRLAEAAAFAESRAAWIAERLAELPQRDDLTPGATIALFGRPCRLVGLAKGRAKLSEDADGLVLAAPEGEGFTRAVVRLIKAAARRVLSERTEVYAAALSQPLPTVAVMDAKARWGSCTPARRAGFGGPARVGRIRYSWRLALAPFAVADYVAAHECAHLVEANHGPGFWALVEDLVGDPRPHRAWLRTHGARLHAFGGA